MSERGWLGVVDVPGLWVRLELRGGRAVVTGIRLERSDGVKGQDLRSIPLHRIEALANPAPGRTVNLPAALGHSVPSPSNDDLRLEVPEGRSRYPDAFYEQVAELHRWLTAARVRPAPAMSRANGVPVTTIHRWIKEARTRGLLSPSRQASR